MYSVNETTRRRRGPYRKYTVLNSAVPPSTAWYHRRRNKVKSHGDGGVSDKTNCGRPVLGSDSIFGRICSVQTETLTEEGSVGAGALSSTSSDHACHGRHYDDHVPVVDDVPVGGGTSSNDSAEFCPPGSPNTSRRSRRDDESEDDNGGRDTNCSVADDVEHYDSSGDLSLDDTDGEKEDSSVVGDNFQFERYESDALLVNNEVVVNNEIDVVGPPSVTQGHEHVEATTNNSYSNGQASSDGKGLRCSNLEDFDKPLYDGSRLTIATSMLLAKTFSNRYSLSNDGFSALLTLLELHCPTKNVCKETGKMHQQFFVDCKADMHFQWYCRDCHFYCGDVKSSTCPNCDSAGMDSFIQMMIGQQLQSILGRNGILESLEYRKYRKKPVPGTIDDIYDGELYKQHFTDDGYFPGSKPDDPLEKHISLQINTDGVAIFKSSKYGIWPLYGTINELPPEIRYRRENRLFMGLWYGATKPDMKVFLSPFIEELVELRRKGVVIAQDTNPVKIKAIVLTSVADAPARCLMMDFVQFNGRFGCPCCYAEGERCQVNSGYSRVYPFDPNQTEQGCLGHPNLRTATETRAIASEVENNFISSSKATVDPKFGVKGYSPLLSLKGYDIIRGTAIDYMHCVILGVVKRLCHLWFDSSSSKQPWSVRKSLKEINEEIRNFKPAGCISRLPRPIDDMAHWKASEYRSFLLYYSLPILSCHLPQEYLQHYGLFVDAIHILLQSSISKRDLLKAEYMLARFCLDVEKLYGLKEMTFNIHCLLHLCQKVKDLGPLWANSCFFYESLNGDLRRLFHGTQNIDRQIICAVSSQQRMPELERLLPFGSSEAKFYSELTSHHQYTSVRQEITGNLWALGPFSPCAFEEELTTKVTQIIGPISHSNSFLRIQKGRVMIQSEKYRTGNGGARRNSYTVQYANSKFGSVSYYLRCVQATGCRYLAVVKPLLAEVNRTIPVDSNFRPSHIFPVAVGEQYEIIEVESINTICVFLTVKKTSQSFVVKLPNVYESD